MSEEEKKAIEYYQDKEVSFTLENFDKKEFLKALGIAETEEDNFENHQIRFKTLLNLIEKQDKMIDLMAEYIVELIEYSNPGEKRETQEIKEHFRKKVENEK